MVTKKGSCGRTPKIGKTGDPKRTGRGLGRNRRGR